MMDATFQGRDLLLVVLVFCIYARRRMSTALLRPSWIVKSSAVVVIGVDQHAVGRENGAY